MHLTVLQQESEVNGVSSKIYLLPLLVTRGFPLGAKGRLYSVCVRSVVTWKWDLKEDVIRLEINDARKVDGCATLGLRAGFLQRNLGKGQN